ncbi:hypothetical protein HYT17_02355 [Candidatus Microgenomates bacterium]|nr:hypothetical protein [Candidatus Microgenomates bacterium]
MMVRQAHHKKQKGQALIMVILIGIIALIAVVSAATLVISELKKNTAVSFGVSQYQTTYGALENALMRLLRNPNYTGETVILGSSTCTITVVGSSPKTVESRCSDGKYSRKIGAQVTFTGGVMTVSGISELP